MRKLEPRTVKLHVSSLRFFFVKTLKRAYLLIVLRILAFLQFQLGIQE